VIGCYLDDLWARRDGRQGALVAFVGVPLLLVVLNDLVNAQNAAQIFLWLFSFDYLHSPTGRAWPDQLDFRPWLLAFGALFGVLTAALAIRRLLRPAVCGLAATAVLLTWFLLDVYMVKVAPFWSQKDAIAEYYRHRRSPDEKLLAYMMYWRGESFYTKNAIYEGPMEERTVFDMEDADDNLRSWVASHRGRRAYFIYPHGQKGRLESLVPADARSSFTVIYQVNNKFAVAFAEL
jgi:hypothetical protein